MNTQIKSKIEEGPDGHRALYSCGGRVFTFGILMIIWNSANYARGFAWAFGLGRFGLSYLQWVAGSVVFGIFFTLWWVFWGILLYKTYHGTPYRVPFFSGIADRCLAKLDGIK